MVRPYRQGESEHVRRVIKAVYDEYEFSWDPERYHRDLFVLDDDPSPKWVAEHGGEIVGYIGLETFSAIPGNDGTVVEDQGKKRVAGADCELLRLYVLAECRGLGLGKMLTETCIKEAKSQGCQLMEIWSDKLFVEAHGLYKRYGAEVVGERICDDPDEAPEWGMALRLSRAAELLGG